MQVLELWLLMAGFLKNKKRILQGLLSICSRSALGTLVVLHYASIWPLKAVRLFSGIPNESENGCTLWFGILCLWLGQGGNTENCALCSAALRKSWGSKYLTLPAKGFSSCKSQCQLKAPAPNCLSLPVCHTLLSLWVFLQALLSMAAGRVFSVVFSLFFQ